MSGKWLIYILIALSSGCGAEHKSAKSVGPFLSFTTLGLKEKVITLCDVLNQKNTEPSFEGMPFLKEACLSPGAEAQTYEPGVPLRFSHSEVMSSLFSTKSPQLAVKEKTLHVYLRSQVWLNKSSMMTLAEIVHRLRLSSGAITEGLQCGDFEKRSYFALSDKPAINKDLSFATLHGFLLNLKKFNKAADICNPMEINIERIGQAFAVSAVTTVASEVKDSLIKTAKALILLVPHANNVYLDILIHGEMHSFGIDRAMHSASMPMVARGISRVIEYLAYPPH